MASSPQTLSDPRTNGATVLFGDVVKDVNESERNPLDVGLERFIALEHIDPRNLHIHDWGLLEEEVTSFTKRFRKGQVLFAKRRAYQRKVAVAEFDGICSGDILTFEPRDDSLLAELLPFIVESEAFFDHALDTSSGSLSPRTRWSQLQDFAFTLPGKETQRTLADLLWAADVAEQRYLAVASRIGSLINVMTREFLNSGWDEFPCKQLFTTPPKNGLSPRTNADNRGFPTLSLGAVRNGVITADGNTKYAEITSDELERFRLQRDDLLVVRGNGNRLLCGKCAIVREIPDDCFYPDLLIRIAFDPDKLLPDFACVQWNTPSIHRRLLKRAKSTNGIWKINGKDIKQHKLFAPPTDEQNAFLAELKAPHAALAASEFAAEQARNVRNSIVNSLLVPQEEPSCDL